MDDRRDRTFRKVKSARCTRTRVLYLHLQRYPEESNSSRRKVEGWSPGAGEGASTELQFCKMKRARRLGGDGGCTALYTCLVPRSAHLNVIKVVTSVCFFTTIKTREGDVKIIVCSLLLQLC